MPDGEEDVLVNNLVRWISEGYPCCPSQFVGGASTADVIRMREDAAKENNPHKSSKGIGRQPRADNLDPDYVSSIIQKTISADLSRIGEEIKNLGQTVTNSHNLMRGYVQDMFVSLRRDLETLIPTMSARTVFGTPQVPHPDTPVTRKQTSTGGHPVDMRLIIEDAICFANQTISEPANVSLFSFSDYSISSCRPMCSCNFFTLTNVVGCVAQGIEWWRIHPV